MILKQLHLHNFRNYDDLTVDFAPGVNVLIGENAQGKTNLLEAVYAESWLIGRRTKPCYQDRLKNELIRYH